jgi:2-dehydro-3-deoxyphosphogluconate aldolase/(4S)-4-hydroxy-2-oxoglutarate aldolase
MADILKKIHGIGIVPVIALENVEDAAPLAQALCNGGLPVAEVTYRTACAHDAMIEMKKACPQMLVGAGTVLTKEQVDSALDAGAEFIVSPGLNPEIVRYCQEKNVPILPGTANASDIEIALSLGLNTVKFFPAEPLGGIKMISALAAPYTTMKFMPTGGVSPKNMKDYLSNPKIVACGGTWMIDKKAMQEKNFAKIEELTRQAVREMLEIKIKHIGINVPTAEAKATAEMMARLFQGAVSETSKGYFGSPLIEVMNEGYHVGTHGHIAMGVSSTERAMAYFKALGYEFDEESVTYDAHGDAKFAYFKGEFAGFGVHLVNN